MQFKHIALPGLQRRCLLTSWNLYVLTQAEHQSPPEHSNNCIRASSCCPFAQISCSLLFAMAYRCTSRACKVCLNHLVGLLAQDVILLCGMILASPVCLYLDLSHICANLGTLFISAATTLQQHDWTEQQAKSSYDLILSTASLQAGATCKQPRLCEALQATSVLDAASNAKPCKVLAVQQIVKDQLRAVLHGLLKDSSMCLPQTASACWQPRCHAQT